MRNPRTSCSQTVLGTTKMDHPITWKCKITDVIQHVTVCLQSHSNNPKNRNADFGWPSTSNPQVEARTTRHGKNAAIGARYNRRFDNRSSSQTDVEKPKMYPHSRLNVAVDETASRETDQPCVSGTQCKTTHEYHPCCHPNDSRRIRTARPRRRQVRKGRASAIPKSVWPNHPQKDVWPSIMRTHHDDGKDNAESP